MRSSSTPLPIAPWPFVSGDGRARPPFGAAGRAGRELRGSPFDLLRWQYASLVRVGWLRRSLLASARLERTIDAFEQAVLGPLARRR